MERFPFIVIDGIDGVGKTTVAKMLVRQTGACYYKTPSGIFEKMRLDIDVDGDNESKFFFYRYYLLPML